MVSSEYLVIIVLFLLYYIAVLFGERKLIREPGQIIGKFLAVILLYAGVSLIFFSLTGQPLLRDSSDNYNVYIFIMGFVAVLWTIPELLEEFSWFRRFEAGERKKAVKSVKK